MAAFLIGQHFVLGASDPNGTTELLTRLREEQAQLDPADRKKLLRAAVKRRQAVDQGLAMLIDYLTETSEERAAP